MSKIDLTRCLNAKSDVLVGYEYGQRVRNEFDLDNLDRGDGQVEVVLPARLDVVAPSFVQGFFGESVLRLGKEGFYERYSFSGWPRDMLVQVETGLLRALMNREKVLA